MLPGVWEPYNNVCGKWLRANVGATTHTGARARHWGESRETPALGSTLASCGLITRREGGPMSPPSWSRSMMYQHKLASIKC